MTSPRALLRWWHMGRWRRTHGLTEAELAVIRALLPRSDRRSELLLEQASGAPEVKRAMIGRDGCLVSIGYVLDERLLIDVREDIVSPAVEVLDALASRRLRFTVAVRRGGFLNDLRGQAEDGNEWPLHWVVQDGGLGLAVPNWLPPAMPPPERQRIVNELAAWAGCDPVRLSAHGSDILLVSPPASEGDLAVAERRVNRRLPPEYRDFVNICNGLAIRLGRRYEVFGTWDIYGVTEGVAVTSLHEEGLVVLCHEHGKADTAWLVSSDKGQPLRVGHFRMHVRESLQWLEELPTTEH